MSEPIMTGSEIDDLAQLILRTSGPHRNTLIEYAKGLPKFEQRLLQAALDGRLQAKSWQIQ